MKPNKAFQKLRVSCLALVATLVLVHIKGQAFSVPQQGHQRSKSPPQPPEDPQNSQPASQQTPPDRPGIKQKKVWTNDDVILLRTPADNYLAEKETREASEANAAAKVTDKKGSINSGKGTAPGSGLPDSVEETEKKLKETKLYIQEETDALDKLHLGNLDTSTEQREQKQKEIDRLNGLLKTSQRALKALQDHLEVLRGKSRESAPSVDPLKR